MPRRIQRKRTRGWRMPAGAVYVGRPSRWGNPYEVGRTVGIAYGRYGGLYDVHATIDHALAVALFRAFLRARPDTPHLRDIDVLVGRDLACWCPLEDEHGNPVPCHADVLLEVANEGAGA